MPALELRQQTLCAGTACQGNAANCLTSELTTPNYCVVVGLQNVALTSVEAHVVSFAQMICAEVTFLQSIDSDLGEIIKISFINCINQRL